MTQQISYVNEMLRKSIHLSSLWMVVFIGIFPVLLNIVLFGSLLFLIAVVEYGNYKKWPLFTLTYGRFFNRILRDKETQKEFCFSGAPYVLASALMVIILFTDVIAMTSLSIMLIGDTSAALIGRKYGKHKINNDTKTKEGSIAFLATSAIVLIFFYLAFQQSISFLIFGLIGVTAAMFAEIYETQIHLDDNFSIPLVVGCFLSLANLF